MNVGSEVLVNLLQTEEQEDPSAVSWPMVLVDCAKFKAPQENEGDAVVGALESKVKEWLDDNEEAVRKKLQDAPTLVFERLPEKSREYAAGKGELSARLETLKLVTTEAPSDNGGADCMLAFMCSNQAQMWQTLVPLYDSGYELDQLVVCTNSKTNQTVYIVTAKRMPSSEKKKKVLRKKPSLPEDGWKEMFPGSTRDNFQYNQALDYLPLAEQATLWFLACNTKPNDLVWHRSAANVDGKSTFNGSVCFTFFGQAAIAMGRRVITMYDKDKPMDGNEAKKDVEKARAYYAHKDRLHNPDFCSEAEFALTVLCLCKHTGSIDEHCSATAQLPKPPDDDEGEECSLASQPSAAPEQSVLTEPKRASKFSTAWFVGPSTTLESNMDKLLNEDSLWTAAGLVQVGENQQEKESVINIILKDGSAAVITRHPSIKVGLDESVLFDLGSFFDGHWMPRGVESFVEKTFKVHRQGRDAPEWWTPTRLQINDELCFVSSHPQFVDYMRKTNMLSDANVHIYPFVDEVSGRFIVKLQFLKDVAKDDELVWFVPEENLEGNTVHLHMLYDEDHQERTMSLLRGRFINEHGEKIKGLHEAAMKNIGETKHVEASLVSTSGMRDHLRKMRKVLQDGIEETQVTTIRARRLRFREQTPKEREDEGLLPEGEVKLMEKKEWKEGATEVVKAVKAWGKTVLGDDYTLLEAGLYGQHGLIFSTKKLPALPQRPHFDSMFPFFSGHDLLCMVLHSFRHLNINPLCCVQSLFSTMTTRKSTRPSLRQTSTLAYWQKL